MIGSWRCASQVAFVNDSIHKDRDLPGSKLRVHCLAPIMIVDPSDEIIDVLPSLAALRWDRICSSDVLVSLLCIWKVALL